MLWWVVYNENGKAIGKTKNEDVAFKLVYWHRGWTYRPEYEETEAEG